MDLSSNRVAFDRCPDYSLHTLFECFTRFLDACQPAHTYRSSRILIKPNLITAGRGNLACTEGVFILAAARFFQELGARVAVGDSPAFGTATSVLDKIGILPFLTRYSIPVVEFNRIRIVTLSSGVRAGLAAEALDCDLLVNLPRVKAHGQLMVTMAVKNFFGCIGGMRKPMWHMKYGGKEGGLENLIVELLSVLPDSITLVDGITAMHRTGPIGGQPYDLGITACSTNPVGVDRALLSVIGLEPERSPLMKACIRAGLAGTDLEQLEFPLLNPSSVQVDSFKVPAELSPVRFNPFRFVKNNLRRAFHRIGLLS